MIRRWASGLLFCAGAAGCTSTSDHAKSLQDRGRDAGRDAGSDAGARTDGSSTTAEGGRAKDGGPGASEGGSGDGAVAPDARGLDSGVDARAEASADGGAVPTDGSDGASCHVVEEQHPISGANHVAECSVVTYDTVPPSSGNHYPVWAAYRTYSSPIPEGYWVHDLEHGAVVITYNCPSGCDGELAQVAAMIDALPVDPACVQLGQGVQRRVIVTPDPKLDVRFGASAWGFTLRADCFDSAAFAAFVTDHYDQAPESLCNDGQDLSTGVAAGCGENP